ncbi:pilus assembly protein TadG-related protein [Streptomyces sp. NPDC005017]|uniref:pilus assembly protein TadG-related protein n=1 Tax=Streptomyces sp. NPDC005017 TaxID=3364706 RepID=UPI0036A70B65
MTRFSRFGDVGQAFPIYIVVVAGLLFLAFAYLAVGQAAANRNGAQTAADAAALAAAQEARDQLTDAWIEVVLDPDEWQDIFDGNAPVVDACGRAYELAAMNDAEATCNWDSPLRVHVEARTNKPVGESIVPGTEGKKSTETATAVIEPRCDFDPLGAGADDDVLPSLRCDDGEVWELDPEDLVDLPKPEDLFDVHLAD